MTNDEPHDIHNAKDDRKRVMEKQSVHLFGKRLKIAMNGLSNMELSRRSGLSETTIPKYVQGKMYPGLDNLALVAEACGVSLAWLATGCDDRNKSSNTGVNIEKHARESAWQTYDETSRELEAIFRRLNEREKKMLIDTIYRIGIEGLLRQLQEKSGEDRGQEERVPPESR